MDQHLIKILYVEDDRQLAQICKELLDSQGYHTVCAYDGEEGWNAFLRSRPEVVLLDILMPGKNGWELARMIREKDAEAAILFVSNLSDSRDVVSGLDLGADDFIRKEFLLEEVVARIQAVLRRRPELQERTRGRKIGHDTLFVYIEQKLIIRGESFSITPMLSRILQILSEEMNQVVTKSQISQKIWNNDFARNARYLDKYVMRLRRMLEADPSIRLTTIHRVGYSLSRV